jgi:molecular chaperone GrpE
MMQDEHASEEQPAEQPPETGAEAGATNEQSGTEAGATSGVAGSTSDPAGAGGATSEQAPAEAQPDLAAELAREREKATDYMNRWLRAQADFANYRRRAEQEREQQQKGAMVPFFLEILKVLDNYQRAFETLPAELREFSWVQGVMLTYGYLENLLHYYDVKPMETRIGDLFDPNRHQAVTHEETDEHPDGTITAEYQRGYIYQERVLRPALVRVARPKAAASPPTEEAPAEQATS